MSWRVGSWGVGVLTLALGCATPEPAPPRSPAPSDAVEPAPEVAAVEPSEPPERQTTDLEPEPDPVEVLMALDGASSTSVGGPRDGSLTGGVALPSFGPGFRSNPRRPNADAYYGTVEMVQALVHAAGVVHQALPGGEVTFNDLGFEEGGAIAHHGSHRAGRDVDVLFYLIDRQGEPMTSVGAFLDPRGRGFDFKDLSTPDDDVLVRMDVPRTWRFVQALLEGPHAAHVQRIFVVEHLRTMLLRHAERARVPSAIRARFAEVTCQPGAPHDDHLHIRFYCTPEDMADGCEDSGPTYGWRRLALREAGLRPVINRPRRDRPTAPTTSAAEARAAAGPMHSRVESWLTRREAWLERPHPGRPFCR
ncbi:MAG: penicillin-insensitive murein endopeptidase [Sandaracinaceae bacterium]